MVSYFLLLDINHKNSFLISHLLASPRGACWDPYLTRYPHGQAHSLTWPQTAETGYTTSGRRPYLQLSVCGLFLTAIFSGLWVILLQNPWVIFLGTNRDSKQRIIYRWQLSIHRNYINHASSSGYFHIRFLFLSKLYILSSFNVCCFYKGVEWQEG